MVAAMLQAPSPAPRFYPDDPLSAEPTPLGVSMPQPRALSAILEMVDSRFSESGQRHPAGGVIPAGGVNTLGEVMDGDWYVSRHATQRLTIAELERGSGDALPPEASAPWQVLVVKPFGVNSGILVADAKNDLLRPALRSARLRRAGDGGADGRLPLSVCARLPRQRELHRQIRSDAARRPFGGADRVERRPSARARAE